jgi:hypothetical protein
MEAASSPIPSSVPVVRTLLFQVSSLFSGISMVTNESFVFLVVGSFSE